MESVKDLKTDVCLVKPVDEPTEPVSSSTAPLNRSTLMASEQVRDLLKPLDCELVRASDPVRLWANPLV